MKTNTPCAHLSIVVLEQGDKLTTQCTKCGKKMKVVKKPKCSCYGGFDCEVCNPDYYEEQRRTGTAWTKPDHTEQHLEMVSNTTIPPIQSAYLNISTAISDAESAIDAWENEKWANAVMSIDLALEQLQSARYKIQQYKQK